MGLVATPSPDGILYMTCGPEQQATAGTNTMDAAGESCAFIGNVFLEGGSGSKTISSAGGKIVFRNRYGDFCKRRHKCKNRNSRSFGIRT